MSNPFESPTGAAPTGSYTPNTSLTLGLAGSLGLAGLFDGLGILVEAGNIASAGAAIENPAYALAAAGQGLGTFFILLANVGLWLFWQYRAACNVAALGGVTEHGAGTGLVWWFVPFANLVKPYQVVSEIWTASGTLLREPELPHGLVNAWWALWIISNISANIAVRIGGFDISTEGSIAWIASHCLGIGAAIVAAMTVKAIDDLQVRVAAEKKLG